MAQTANYMTAGTGGGRHFATADMYVVYVQWIACDPEC